MIAALFRIGATFRTGALSGMGTLSWMKTVARGGALVAVGAIMLATVTAGCNTSGCTDNQSSLPLAGFYSSTTKQAITLRTVEIGGVGAPGDSLLYTSGTELSQVYLPFRSQFDNTSYCIHYTQEGLEDPALNDTISFAYTSQPYFASEECGAMLRYDITGLSYTNHLIDSVVVTDPVITNTDTERIRIYFRTSSAEQ